MRQIKFKAWCKNTKVMINHVSGILYSVQGRPCRVSGYMDESKNFTNPVVTISFQLMQYTGLKDKNGVEIYEGDVALVRGFTERGDGHFDDALMEVLFSPHFGWVLSCTYESENLSDVDCEVVGNIHENPDLL